MSIIALKNPAGSSWTRNLKDEKDIPDQVFPLNSFVLKNKSDILAEVYLNGTFVGEVERYSSDSFLGRAYESFEVKNPDGQEFSADDLVAVCSKDISVTQMPFNPQIDIMEENLDRYVSGCDARISKSSTITTDAIKYWINVQNGLIAQRKLELAGTASMGSYEVDFGGGDLVAGSVGINSILSDVKRYKKTISDSGFDYTVTDCSIAGWILDYKKAIDRTINSSIITDRGNAANAFDDDMTTLSDSYHCVGTCEHLKLKFNDLYDVDEVHCSIYGRSGSAGVSYAKVYLSQDGTDWTLVGTITFPDNSWANHVIHALTLGMTNQKYVKIEGVGSSPVAEFQIRDISIIS